MTFKFHFRNIWLTFKLLTRLPRLFNMCSLKSSWDRHLFHLLHRGLMVLARRTMRVYSILSILSLVILVGLTWKRSFLFKLRQLVLQVFLMDLVRRTLGCTTFLRWEGQMCCFCSLGLRHNYIFTRHLLLEIWKVNGEIVPES